MDDEQGGILSRRFGPLPVWQWLGIITIAAVVFYLAFSKGKKPANAEDTAQPDYTPVNDVPQFVIQNTFPLPAYAPALTPTPVPAQPSSPTPTPTPSTPSTPSKTPGNPAKSTTGHGTVTVAKYTTRNPPWNSTISGIAAHYGIRDWHSVWNAPQNAALRAKRKNNPSLIQPGDKVYVP